MEYPDRLSELQKYYFLMGETCNLIPSSAVDTLVRSGYPASTHTLMNVRMGKTHNLEILIDLIHSHLPNFQFNPKLRPVAAEFPIFNQPVESPAESPVESPVEQ